jgi:hypothetical protein
VMPVSLNLLVENVLLVSITVISVKLKPLVWHAVRDILTIPMLLLIDVTLQLLVVNKDNTFKLVLMLVNIVLLDVIYAQKLIMFINVINVLIQLTNIMVKIVYQL